MQFQHTHKFWSSLAVGGATVAMALPATAAFGQTAVHWDPAHDVVKFTAMGTRVPAGGKATADIVHVRFAHTSGRVAATMRLRDYGGRWNYIEIIKTALARYFVLGQGRRDRHVFRLYRGSVDNPRRVGCDGLSARVDRSKSTFRVLVPTNCLQRPRWIQMGLGYDVFTIGERGADFVDDSLRSGLSAGNRLTFTRKLYAG